MKQPGYVPPLESILRALSVDPAAFEDSDQITLPKEFFKFILSIALKDIEFNEAGYLNQNPDIAEKLRTSALTDAREHYINEGYFSRRAGGTPAVDERWYLATYPDVARALQLGKVKSAREHYNIVGGAEGRSPNSFYVNAALAWKKAISKNGSIK